MFGSKSPFRCLDRGHWSLVSGLVVVSAVYLLREHGLNSRERRLRKELTNSQAEISKLVMKVLHELQCAPVPFSFADTCSSTFSALRMNGCDCVSADCQHAALHAVSRASANHPPHLHHVYCDALSTHASCVSPLLLNQLLWSYSTSEDCNTVVYCPTILVLHVDEVLLLINSTGCC